MAGRLGHVFLLIGPSGSGKTTLIREIRKRYPQIRFIPSTTTRPPRPGETDRVEYYFVSGREFEAISAAGGFFEWETIHGNRYGSSRERLTGAVDRGVIGITSIDILGGAKIKAAMGEDATTVFVRSSSLEELKRRLIARGDTDLDDMGNRLARAGMEMELAGRCDYTLLNDDLGVAVNTLAKIILLHIPDLVSASHRQN